MLRFSSLLFVMLALCSGELFGASLRQSVNRSRSVTRVHRVSPAQGMSGRSSQETRVHRLVSPAQGMSGRSNQENEKGVELVNENGDEKFWGGTEVILSPEGDGKLPVIVENKDPYHYHAGSGGIQKFAKKNFHIILFSLVKMILVVSAKIIAMFLLVAKSAAFGFFALGFSTALFSILA